MPNDNSTVYSTGDIDMSIAARLGFIRAQSESGRRNRHAEGWRAAYREDVRRRGKARVRDVAVIR
jgi:hypothetical protein